MLRKDLMAHYLEGSQLVVRRWVYFIVVLETGETIRWKIREIVQYNGV